LVTKPSEAANTVLIKTIRISNAVAGFSTENITSSLHSESVQNPKTVKLPFNVTEEELAIFLEPLPSINAVSVARSPSGLEHGFPWTGTFFSANTTADGSVELLESNTSELAGFVAITTPTMVIPPESSSSEVVSAYIRSTQSSNQLFFSIHQCANYLSRERSTQNIQDTLTSYSL
jgi:hypothetical protein